MFEVALFELTRHFSVALGNEHDEHVVGKFPNCFGLADSESHVRRKRHSIVRYVDDNKRGASCERSGLSNIPEFLFTVYSAPDYFPVK